MANKNGKSRQGQGGGPKTKEGKRRSSRNATKHGIMAVHPVIIEEHETLEEWEEFRDGIVESLQPEGPLEHDYAHTIAWLRWRLKRVMHYETAEINFQYQQTAEHLLVADVYRAGGEDVPDPDPGTVFAYQQRKVIPQGSSLENVMRFEAHVHRLQRQNLIDLWTLQAKRQGRDVNVHRLDISSPPRQFGPTSRPALPKELAGPKDLLE